MSELVGHNRKTLQKQVMGISGLTSYMKQVKTDVPARELAGQTIAVDANACFYADYAVSVSNVLKDDHDYKILQHGIDFEDVLDRCYWRIRYTVEKWLLLRINVVLITDGEATDAKSVTQESRASVGAKKYNIACESAEKLCELLQIPYLGGYQMSSEFQEKMKDPQYTTAIQKAWDQISKALATAIHPTKADWTQLMIRIGKDYPTVRIYQSSVEAETLACYLHLQGEVDHVYSRDSDCAAYGLQQWFFNWSSFDETFSQIKRKDLAHAIGIPVARLLDFCIMIGTDYGNRIPEVGPKTARQILNHQSLDQYREKERERCDCLNIEECREIFGLVHAPSYLDLNDLSVRVFSGIEIRPCTPTPCNTLTISS